MCTSADDERVTSLNCRTATVLWHSTYKSPASQLGSARGSFLCHMDKGARHSNWTALSNWGTQMDWRLGGPSINGLSVYYLKFVGIFLALHLLQSNKKLLELSFNQPFPSQWNSLVKEESRKAQTSNSRSLCFELAPPPQKRLFSRWGQRAAIANQDQALALWPSWDCCGVVLWPGRSIQLLPKKKQGTILPSNPIMLATCSSAPSHPLQMFLKDCFPNSRQFIEHEVRAIGGVTSHLTILPTA